LTLKAIFVILFSFAMHVVLNALTQQGTFSVRRYIFSILGPTQFDIHTASCRGSSAELNVCKLASKQVAETKVGITAQKFISPTEDSNRATC